MTTQPSRDEIRAFCAGALPPKRFHSVDAWLASVPEAEAERVLAEAGVSDAATAPLTGLQLGEPPPAGFVTDLPRGRLRPGLPLGEGGMATVAAAHDRVLDRVVAVKVLRPRATDETLEHYQVRETAFRREAALTAGLEHPAIPPVYDVGRSDGQPAFAMKRLSGKSLATVIGEGGHALAERMEILLRVAEAVAYAHSRGVVHRDLTPQNILLGEFGAVYVLDWGLAARSGAHDGVRAGTPGWMAPEQHDDAAADPRMDVFGLGTLLFFATCGQAPERHDLSALDAGQVPRGLAALIRRCLAVAPTARYADAGAVAEDLRRWLADGVTLAQEATAVELAWLRLRRSPRLRTAAAMTLLAALLAGGAWWMALQGHHAEAEARLAQLAAGTALDSAATVAVALDEVRSIALHHPRLDAASALLARLQAVYDMASRREHDDAVRGRLAGLLQRTRTHGPWAGGIHSWREAIREAGLSMDPERVADDARILRDSPLQAAIAEALAFLWRAEKERGAHHHATGTADLLAAAGPTPAWQALGRLLNRSEFAGRDPIFCSCADSEQTLTEAKPTALALALFAPEPRLAAAARAALTQRPGDFWPLIASARASLADGDAAAAGELALVASGVEPGSVLPPLLLGHIAVLRKDRPGLERAVLRALAIDAGNDELRELQSILADERRWPEAAPAAH